MAARAKPLPTTTEREEQRLEEVLRALDWLFGKLSKEDDLDLRAALKRFAGADDQSAPGRYHALTVRMLCSYERASDAKIVVLGTDKTPVNRKAYVFVNATLSGEFFRRMVTPGAPALTEHAKELRIKQIQTGEARRMLLELGAATLSPVSKQGTLLVDGALYIPSRIAAIQKAVQPLYRGGRNPSTVYADGLNFLTALRFWREPTALPEKGNGNSYGKDLHEILRDEGAKESPEGFYARVHYALYSSKQMRKGTVWIPLSSFKIKARAFTKLTLFAVEKQRFKARTSAFSACVQDLYASRRVFGQPETRDAQKNASWWREICLQAARLAVGAGLPKETSPAHLDPAAQYAIESYLALGRAIFEPRCDAVSSPRDGSPGGYLLSTLGIFRPHACATTRRASTFLQAPDLDVAEKRSENLKLLLDAAYSRGLPLLPEESKRRIQRHVQSQSAALNRRRRLLDTAATFAQREQFLGRFFARMSRSVETARWSYAQAGDLPPDKDGFRRFLRVVAVSVEGAHSNVADAVDQFCREALMRELAMKELAMKELAMKELLKRTSEPEYALQMRSLVSSVLSGAHRSLWTRGGRKLDAKRCFSFWQRSLESAPHAEEDRERFGEAMRAMDCLYQRAASFGVRLSAEALRIVRPPGSRRAYQELYSRAKSWAVLEAQQDADSAYASAVDFLQYAWLLPKRDEFAQIAAGKDARGIGDDRFLLGLLRLSDYVRALVECVAEALLETARHVFGAKDGDPLLAHATTLLEDTLGAGKSGRYTWDSRFQSYRASVSAAQLYQSDSYFWSTDRHLWAIQRLIVSQPIGRFSPPQDGHGSRWREKCCVTKRR